MPLQEDSQGRRGSFGPGRGHRKDRLEKHCSMERGAQQGAAHPGLGIAGQGVTAAHLWDTQQVAAHGSTCLVSTGDQEIGC